MLAREALDAARRPLGTSGAWDAFRAHAVEAFPQEALGLIDQYGHYHRLRNIALDPRAHAAADAQEWAGWLASGKVQALCHSHPGGPDCPSELDMRTQQECEIPFVICSTNGTATTEPFVWGDDLIDERPLVGRPFRHGVNDCYGLIRAHRLETFGQLLPDYPRGWEWWLPEYKGEADLYRRFFADAGYFEISAGDVQPNDVWLAAIRSQTPNHAGVWLGDGLALHHPSGGLASDPSRLSRREPLARWTPFVTHWVRRK